MENNLNVGMSYEVEETVTDEKTATALGSGGVDVLATPYMIALMEKTSRLSVQPGLAEGSTTVGTKVNIEHLSASPVGIKIKVKSTLKEIEGRRLCFDVEAYDEKVKIGSGTHERFIIDIEKFVSKANSKLN